MDFAELRRFSAGSGPLTPLTRRSAPDSAPSPAPANAQHFLCNIPCGVTVGGMTRPEVRTLRDAAPLAALAHPFRSRIMDALKVDGPSTASMLALRTGQAVGNASHHLKVLAAAGLVEEAPELARDKRERWWRLVTTGTRWSRRELTDQAAITAAEEAEALNLRRQQERVRDWLVNAESAPEWDDVAFATSELAEADPRGARAGGPGGHRRARALGQPRRARRRRSTANRSSSSPAASRASRELRRRRRRRPPLPRSRATATSGCSGSARACRCSGR